MEPGQFAAVIFGLSSAAVWGAGDFSGGMATKRSNVFSVLIASQTIGLLFLLGLAIAFGDQIPPLSDLLWGVAGGFFGTVGVVVFYRALATSRMGIAAPVSALVTAIVPVVAGWILEGIPSILKILGFLVAFAAIWVISQEQGEGKVEPRDLVLPAIAGLGFGFFFLFVGLASDNSAFYPLVAGRLASLPTLLLIAIATKQPLIPSRPALPFALAAGILDSGGNAFFALATQSGRLDIAAVLASLYPASTVFLAWLILKERLSLHQGAGVIAALVAIVLITS